MKQSNHLLATKTHVCFALFIAIVCYFSTQIGNASPERGKEPLMRICIGENIGSVSITNTKSLRISSLTGVGDEGWDLLPKALLTVKADGTRLTVTVKNDETNLVASPLAQPSLYNTEGIQSPAIPATFEGPIHITPVSDVGTSVGGKFYRGAFELAISGSGLRVINEVPMEQYLKSVVPSEMYSSWPLEALKAQAVAARTYAVRNMLRHASAGFNLCNGQHCQVYKGIASETAASSVAVEATLGQVATYGGAPIDAQFHSSSGGMTEDPKIVWGGSLPYLKPVDSPEVNCPYSAWSVDISAADVTKKFAQAGYNIGQILDISPTVVGVSGRISLATIRGASGKVDVKGERLRSILGLNSTLLVTYPLKANTDLDVTTDPSVVESINAIPQIFRFKGRGFGHGVGMSQWGAQTKAVAGYTYDLILKHYYVGIALEKWY